MLLRLWPGRWPLDPRSGLYSLAMRMPTIRLLMVAGLCLALVGCGRSGLSGARGDALEDFCSGGAAKAVINGVASKAKVTGGFDMMMQCCESASFTVSTASFDYKVRARWVVQFGHEVFPATIDLAHPSEGWHSSVELACSSGEVCYPPPDAYDSGLQGWLEVARSGDGGFGSGYHMGICLRVAEAPERPHPLLHSFELFAPDITATLSR